MHFPFYFTYIPPFTKVAFSRFQLDFFFEQVFFFFFCFTYLFYIFFLTFHFTGKFHLCNFLFAFRHSSSHFMCKFLQQQLHCEFNFLLAIQFLIIFTFKCTKIKFFVIWISDVKFQKHLQIFTNTHTCRPFWDFIRFFETIDKFLFIFTS